MKLRDQGGLINSGQPYLEIINVFPYEKYQKMISVLLAEESSWGAEMTLFSVCEEGTVPGFVSREILWYPKMHGESINFHHEISLIHRPRRKNNGDKTNRGTDGLQRNSAKQRSSTCKSYVEILRSIRRKHKNGWMFSYFIFIYMNIYSYYKICKGSVLKSI